VVHITGNFLSEAPLSPKAREALGDAIEQGWADPGKLAHSAARARILHEGAMASLAVNLRLRADEIEILGEPSLGHFYAIAGLLGPKEALVYSKVDRKEVISVAREHQGSFALSVAASGQIDPGSLKVYNKRTGVLALQVANGETGVIQEVEALIADAGVLRIAADFSSAGTRVPLPSRWDTAFFDARTWQGPQGVGVLAIHTGARWKNPLPHLGNARTPQSASLPLTITAAVALEECLEGQKVENARLRILSRELRENISSSIEHCEIAGSLDDSLPHITSFSFLYVEGEELLRRLDAAGFAVDSGSACTAEDLKPSHVLAEMGVLTHGNIRITLHRDCTPAQVTQLAQAIEAAVIDLRSP
jgi:cysteine desulfurase